MTRRRFPASLSIATISMLLLAGCGDDDETTTSSTTAATVEITTTSTAAPTTVAADIPEVRAESQVSEKAFLTGVAVSAGESPSRPEVTFDFIEGFPGYTVGYSTMPPRQDGSGNEVPLKGSNALSVRFSPAGSVKLTGGYVQTYTGPDRLNSTNAPLTEVAKVSDFEGSLVWAVGLTEKRPFTVTTEKPNAATYRVKITFS